MFHTALSQGKHIAQEKERSPFESKWKGQSKNLLEPKHKGQKEILQTQVKGQGY